jgi:hypothetical protein
MDRHVRWLRDLTIRSVGERLLLEAGTVATMLAVILQVRGVSIALALLGSLLGAQLVVATRLTATVAVNSRRTAYLTRASQLDITTLELAPIGNQHAETGSILAHHDLWPLGQLQINATSDEPGVAVFQTTSRVALAIAGPAVEPMLISRLNDGRIVVTSSDFVMPNEMLVVNRHARSTTDALVRLHAQAIHWLSRRWLVPVASGPELAVDLLVLEKQSFADPGPVLGPLVELSERPSTLRLTVTPNASDVRQLALPDRSTKEAELSPAQLSPDQIRRRASLR